MLDKAVICFLSFLLSSFALPFCIKLARYSNFLDFPNNTLKNHRIPIPYLGGLAVIIGFFGVFFLFYNSLLYTESSFFCALFMLFLIGLIDDRYSLSPLQKFFSQFCATLIFFLGARFQFPFMILPIYIFWTLTIINAWNLIDIMDGMASAVGIMATVGFIVIASIQHNVSAELLLGAFLGSLVAFFLYNTPPAKIYLGDAGSLFIGGFLGLIPFYITFDMVCQSCVPFILCAIPLLECVSLVVIRTYLGLPFYHGSKHHFMHYLKKQGWTTKQILFYLISLGCFLNSVSVLVVLGYCSLLSVFLLALFFLFVWFSILFSNVSKKMFF